MSKIPTKRGSRLNPSSLCPPKVMKSSDASSLTESRLLGEQSENAMMTPVRFASNEAQSFSLASSAAKADYFSPVVKSVTKDPRSAQKNYDVRSLRDKLFLIEKENLQLSSDCSRLSNEKKIVQEKLNQLEKDINFKETALTQKLQKKQEELDKTVKILEDKERCLEFNENKLQQLKIDLEKDLEIKTRKLEEMQSEVNDLKDSLRSCQLELKKESMMRENDKKLQMHLIKVKNDELKKAQEQNSLSTSSMLQAQELEELKNELQDAKRKIKEYEASEIINSANKCLENQVRDLKKELRAKEIETKSWKECAENTFLLREEKASLEQTIKTMKMRLEELTPIEDKWNRSMEELSKWKRIQSFIPQIVNPNDVITRIQELKDELASVKNQLITLNEEKCKNGASDLCGLSFLDGDPMSVPYLERSELEKDVSSLRESKVQLETELRSVKKKLVFVERQRDSANSVLSSYEKELETQNENQSLKIIEHLRLENQNYKDMAEEYDVTVKELRRKLEDLYSALSEVRTLNESLMKSRDCHASFLGQTGAAFNLCGPSTPGESTLLAMDAEPSIPARNQTVIQEASPKNMKILTLKNDLVLQTKLAFISELNNLKSENEALKKKIVGMEAQKQRLMEETRAALMNATSAGVGEQTLAFCVKSTDEFKQLQNKLERTEFAAKEIMKRQLYMKEIFFYCFGYEFKFKPKETECVYLLPSFRPPHTNSNKDYQIHLERIEEKWSIMDNDSVVYNSYSHLFQNLSHSAPFFAQVVTELYEQFDPIDPPEFSS